MNDGKSWLDAAKDFVTELRNVDEELKNVNKYYNGLTSVMRSISF